MEEKENVTEVGEYHPPKITKENINPDAKTPKGKIMLWVKSILFTLLSSLLVSCAAYALIAPNDFTIGGIAGISILLDIAFGVPQWCITFGLNLPLVVLSFFFVKKRFAILTTINILSQSLWLFLLEEFFPTFEIVFPGGEASKLFAALAAGLCLGTGIALAFKTGGSTGGADILAVMIQKKIGANSIAWILFTINCIVIGSSVFVLDKYNPDGTLALGATLLPVVLSAFEAYIDSRTNEMLTNGLHSGVEFRIITDKPEEMAVALMKELSRGVTAMPAKGMYTKETHTMIVCVISRRQVATLKRIMKQVDPDSFAVMTKVSQVLGLGFYREEA